MGEPLTRGAYREYREIHADVDRPSFSTIIRPPRGSESWKAACRANDITSGAAERDSPTTGDGVGALRAAATEVGEPLGADEYDAWRGERPDAQGMHGEYTTSPGITGWADWCVRAGSTPARTHTWTPLECVYALRLADRSVDGLLSRSACDDWRARQAGVYPSGSTVSTHWPTFTAARTVALGDRDDVPPETWDENTS